MKKNIKYIRAGAGRKKITDGTKKKQISVYIKGIDIQRHGGEENLKGKFITLSQS